MDKSTSSTDIGVGDRVRLRGGPEGQVAGIIVEDNTPFRVLLHVRLQSNEIIEIYLDDVDRV